MKNIEGPKTQIPASELEELINYGTEAEDKGYQSPELAAQLAGLRLALSDQNDQNEL